MKTIYYQKTFPKISKIIDEEFLCPDYVDAISTYIPLISGYSVDLLLQKFFTSFPAWVNYLLNIRNLLVTPLGLKKGEKAISNTINKNKTFEIGEKAIYFKVIKRNENEIIMAEEDSHLNFRTSILIDKTEKPGFMRIYSITLVKYNNWLGRLYFIPVKHFHKLIIKTLLKNISKSLLK